MMARGKVFWVVGVVGLLAVALGLALGVDRGGQAQLAGYGYPAKVLCGTLSYADLWTGEVVEIALRTAVNVHNPNDVEADLYKKAVLALPESETPLPPGDNPMSLPVRPDGAFEVDCPDVLSLLGTIAPEEDPTAAAGTGTCFDGINNNADLRIDLDDPACFVKGFVVIETPEDLDVVGVYTAQRVLDDATPGVGHSLEVDTIERRDLPPLPPDPTGDLVNSYAAKFVCGNPGDPAGYYKPLVPGSYFTAINIHNPSDVDGVTLGKKVVVALSEYEDQWEPTPFFEFYLGPNEAFEIDCPDIVGLLNAAGLMPQMSYVKGFVVVQAPEELDVTAVYLSTDEAIIPPDGGVGVSLDIEPVSGQLVPAPPQPLAICCDCPEPPPPFCFNAQTEDDCLQAGCFPVLDAVCPAEYQPDVLCEPVLP